MIDDMSTHVSHLCLILNFASIFMLKCHPFKFTVAVHAGDRLWIE